MVQNSNVEVRFFASGYCVAHEKIVNPIGGRGKCKFYAVWALIHVPKLGYLLFDTGYSEAFTKATQSFPSRLYRWATPMILNQEETAKSILVKKGIQPNDIQYIILSHFHADHLAGLSDFPNSTIICRKSAYLQLKSLKGFKAVCKGILHALLPNDFEKRLLFIEDVADKRIVNKYGLEQFWFLGIEELTLLALPGHARGMLGFVLHNHDEHILYATDASWSYNTYKQYILPKKIVNIFFDSWVDFVATQNKIRTYENDHKDLKVLFSHCPKTMEIIYNAF